MPVQTQILTRRGAAATWTSTNPTLGAGEIGFESDTNKFKIGTGSTAWVSLPYASNVSPLTTKGDLYTYSTDNARLAVGANGETLVADSSTATGLRYNPPVNSLSNPLINAGFDFAQRGTSVTVSGTIAYTLDRWLGRTSGVGGSVVVTRETTGDTTNLPNIQYCARSRRATGSSDGSDLELYQAIETTNSLPFVGKTVTFSYYLRKSANYTGSFQAVLYYGTGTDQPQPRVFTGAVAAGALTTITTTWTRYVITATIPTTATQIGVMFRHRPAGTAGADDYYEVTGAQIDVGTWTASTAPTFRRNAATIQGELAACQRYYYRQTAAQVYSTFSTYAPALSTTVVDGVVPLPVTMRTIPTSVDSASVAANDNVNAPYTGGTITITGSSNTTNTLAIRYTHGSAALTQYRSYALIANNTTAAYLGFSAEL
jgi:hypothetical protein